MANLILDVYDFLSNYKIFDVFRDLNGAFYIASVGCNDTFPTKRSSSTANLILDVHDFLSNYKIFDVQ